MVIEVKWCFEVFLIHHQTSQKLMLDKNELLVSQLFIASNKRNVPRHLYHWYIESNDFHMTHCS